MHDARPLPLRDRHVRTVLLGLHVDDGGGGVSEARFITGDVFDVLATLPDDSVDLVLTSPPFLALRSYLPADHASKAKEIGSEGTPAAFLDVMLKLTAEWARVLAPHGSIAIELGDTYAGSGGAGGDYRDGKLREGQQTFDGSARRGRSRVTMPDGRTIQPNGIGNGEPRSGDGWPMDKSLCGIPTLYAWSLAYGKNLLTGEQSPAERWRVRNVVAWCRPNPPVGSLGDKFRPATSYITCATRAVDRYWDLEAVRTPLARDYSREDPATLGGREFDRDGTITHDRTSVANPAGAPPLDWWEVSTEAFSGSHYATWPRKLLVRPIEAMCPRHVCRTCGKPRRRLVEDNDELAAAKAATKGKWQSGGLERGNKHPNGDDFILAPGYKVTVGWSDCGHDDYRRGVVLDPFAGTGTTLAVATGTGRDAIGIDLDPRNADHATDRIGGLFMVPEDTP